MGAVAHPFSQEAALKRALRAHLRNLGFTKDEAGDLVLPGEGKDVIRKLHRGQRRERLSTAQPFLERALPRTLPHFANGADIHPDQVAFALRLVKSETLEADLFRVAALTWSVPVSPGFGRRMRYLVWDEYHDRLAGIIALGDPVYNLSVRDKLIGWSVHDRADRLVNILDAYVLGAVPPYNFLLGGKTVACLIRSRDVYDDFSKLYGETVGVISGKAKHAHLVAVTTTSSMGRSAIYNRLKLDGEYYFKKIGFTEGWGHFHITETLFDRMRLFLRQKNHAYADQHQYGKGPNWRLRTIRAALKELNFNENTLRHGIRREVFVSELASNAFDVLRTDGLAPQISTLRTVAEISALARDRWIIPRAARGEVNYRAWQREMIPLLIKGRLDSLSVVQTATG